VLLFDVWIPPPTHYLSPKPQTLGAPEAVAMAWSTGEKATAQMPRLWPFSVRASTRFGILQTLAVRSWLAVQITAGAPNSCG